MTEPEDAATPAPAVDPARPATRTWVLWGLWRLVLAAVCVFVIVQTDGWRRGIWVFLLVTVVLTSWFFRPGRLGGVSPALRQPGDHRVVLQVTGGRPVHVIRQLRRITGADLVAAK